MRIPLLDLRLQYKKIKKEINGAIDNVLSSGTFILGENVKKFEEEFAEFCGARYAVGVASGTDALVLALMACGIGKGDLVITTPFTFIATSEAIISAGARPVFIDIKPDSFNIDPEKIEKFFKKIADKKRLKKVKAIIPVHLFGQACDMQRILKIARKFKLKVIEDCAQAIGATFKNKKVGTFGDCGCFSFFPSKNLGAYGDGGIVITNNRSLHKKIAMLRFHGARDKYHHILQGKNSRLDEIQAAILRVKLKFINKWNKARRKNASIYRMLFGKDKSNNSIILPVELENRTHVYNIFAIRVKQRDRLRNCLTKKNIATGLHYPIALHLERVYRRLGYVKGDFPNAEIAAKTIISLPMYPELSLSQINRVAQQTLEFFS